MEMRTLQLLFFSYHRRTEAAAACVLTYLKVIFARLLYRRKRTFAVQQLMSAKCQKRTLVVQTERPPRGCGSTPILTDRNLHAAAYFFTCPHNFLPRACAILAIEGDGIDHPKKPKKKDEKKGKLAHIVSLSVRCV
jgi:hypothetical protein